MTVHVLGETYTLNFIPEEEDEVADEFPDALNVAIIGRPNAGKSSLFNRILGADRSIVSNIAGTRKRTSGTKSFMPFSTKAALQKTLPGRRRKKWWTGSPSSFPSLLQRFGRWMPCDKRGGTS